ncbi:MAG: T9SS type A sorting domain-containing protein, partial [bacterium]
ELVHTQTITVEDNTAPTFNESLPSNITVECDAIPSAVTLTASDTCGSASVVYSESSAAGSCANEEVITRIWTATDDCGNELVHTQTITVEDNTAPTWIDEPSDESVICDGNEQSAFDNWLLSFSGQDSCGSVTLINDGDGTTVSCGESYEVQFQLGDECGNRIIATATFSIEETLSDNDLDIQKLKILPNPASNSITIQGTYRYIDIYFFNVAGQKVYETGTYTNSNVSLDLSSGVYLVLIKSDRGQIMKKLIIE